MGYDMGSAVKGDKSNADMYEGQSAHYQFPYAPTAVALLPADNGVSR